MLHIPRSVVPNSFTVGNMVFGFMSIVFAVNHNDFTKSAWMIGVAAILDALDGKIARITNSSSKFGVEYDSLADVVSFGVAPSVLIYQYYYIQMDHSIGLFFSFMPLLFGSIRLARFNVQLTGFTKTHFSGLPIPAAAITIGSYILLMEKYFEGQSFPRLLIVLTFIVSLLMVSNVRYEVFPKVSFKGGARQKLIFAGMVILLILILMYPNLVIFPFMILYILGGLIASAFIKGSEQRKRRLTKRQDRRTGKERRHDDDDADEDEILN